MSQKLENLPEGGRGLKIMSDLADDLSYARTPDEQNCLSIGKNFDNDFDSQVRETSQKYKKSNLVDGFFGWFNRLKNGLGSRSDRSSPHGAPIQQTEKTVKTKLSELEEVLLWFSSLQDLIPKAVWWQCQTVLAEGFTNAVRHAHKDLPVETPIEVEATIFKGRLEIKIWDRGEPFDFEAKLRELMEMDIDPLERESGRGLIFMGSLADRVTYTRTADERNCQLIVKNF